MYIVHVHVHMHELCTYRVAHSMHFVIVFFAILQFCFFCQIQTALLSSPLIYSVTIEFEYRNLKRRKSRFDNNRLSPFLRILSMITVSYRSNSSIFHAQNVRSYFHCFYLSLSPILFLLFSLSANAAVLLLLLVCYCWYFID